MPLKVSQFFYLSLFKKTKLYASKMLQEELNIFDINSLYIECTIIATKYNLSSCHYVNLQSAPETFQNI